MNSQWSLDVRTLGLVIVVIYYCWAMLLAMMWRTRKTYSGFGYLVLYVLGAAVGMQFLLLENLLPNLITLFIGNAFLGFSALMILKGTRIFLCIGGAITRYWIAFGLLEVFHAYFLFIDPDWKYRVFLFSIFSGSVLAAAALALFTKAPKDYRFSARFAGIIIGSLSGVFFLRSLLVFFLTHSQSNFASDPLQGASFLAFTISSFFMMLAFIMMNNQRLEVELRDAETDLKKNVESLQFALKEIKTLSGLLPICASCKKIRVEEEYWQKIEDYISSHSDARFSHGLCPECLKELYPEYAEEILKPLSNHKES